MKTTKLNSEEAVDRLKAEFESLNNMCDKFVVISVTFINKTSYSFRIFDHKGNTLLLVIFYY